jgi:hypothetical protein
MRPPRARKRQYAPVEEQIRGGIQRADLRPEGADEVPDEPLVDPRGIGGGVADGGSQPPVSGPPSSSFKRGGAVRARKGRADDGGAGDSGGCAGGSFPRRPAA